MTSHNRDDSKPETLRQAKRWDIVKMRYLRIGLCHRCAAQAAWGHQNNSGGWKRIHPPCADCAPVVAALPSSTPNPLWRKFGRPQVRENTAAPRTTQIAVEDIDVQLSAREGAQK